MFSDKLQILGKKIVNISTINSGLAGIVYSVDTEDSESYIVKNYTPDSENSITREWNALNLLYNAGFSVPKPYALTDNGLVMQKIKGKNLWDVFENASQIEKEQYIKNFTQLLLELHSIDIDLVDEPQAFSDTQGFILSELEAIKSLRKKYSVFNHDKAIEAIEQKAKNVVNAPLAIIHRDFHPWNVLMDDDGKLYVIDLICDVGDYRMDVAYSYNLMTRASYDYFGEEFLKCYTSKRPHVVQDFEFFKYLSSLRWIFSVEISMEENEYSDYLRKMIAKSLCGLE